MTNLETKLSLKWVDNLRRECSRRHERIKLLKTHGGDFQETGLSDYIGCWNGRFIAIEFKVEKNKPTPDQIEFLINIRECQGIGFLVTFKHDGVQHNHTEYGALVYAQKHGYCNFDYDY